MVGKESSPYDKSPVKDELHCFSQLIVKGTVILSGHKSSLISKLNSFSLFTLKYILWLTASLNLSVRILRAFRRN